jgi:hypothetical protein
MPTYTLSHLTTILNFATPKLKNTNWLKYQNKCDFPLHVQEKGFKISSVKCR